LEAAITLTKEDKAIKLLLSNGKILDPNFALAPLKCNTATKIPKLITAEDDMPVNFTTSCSMPSLHLRKYMSWVHHQLNITYHDVYHFLRHFMTCGSNNLRTLSFLLSKWCCCKYDVVSYHK
jgi:hypothetical protein